MESGSSKVRYSPVSLCKNASYIKGFRFPGISYQWPNAGTLACGLFFSPVVSEINSPEWTSHIASCKSRTKVRSHIIVCGTWSHGFWRLIAVHIECANRVSRSEINRYRRISDFGRRPESCTNVAPAGASRVQYHLSFIGLLPQESTQDSLPTGHNTELPLLKAAFRGSIWQDICTTCLQVYVPTNRSKVRNS